MNHPKYVVGVGASAGGLDAIERFFDSTPPDSGMAFVVIQHLSPDFKSMMNQLLSRHTSMQIQLAEDRMPIEANGIYLIPARKNMIVGNGCLGLTDQEPREGLQLPIDIFFHSLAEAYGENGIAVVLSGTGSDGSRGIQAVHKAGGLVIVQDVDSAAFDGMPRNAVATGAVDVVCSPDAMTKQILEFADDPKHFVRGQVEASDAVVADDDRLRLFRLFRSRYGIDFTFYKPTTINRRLERRMQLARADSLEEYVSRVEEDGDEADALYRDLLVEVTRFFRDREAFDRLRFELIPQLVQDAEDEIRVWVPGCATGEEAYSLAIILHHAVRTADKDVRIKIFGTDMHQKSLEAASAAVFRQDSVVNVPDEFTKNCFSKVGELFHLSRSIREHVVFAQHDITKDPPFTRLNLISCRNVLIYLEPEVQQRVMSMFQFGLRTGGLLFLGPSETIGDQAGEFETLDQHWRIYRKIRETRLPGYGAFPVGGNFPRVMIAPRSRYLARNKPATGPRKSIDISERLMARYVPPSFVVDQYHDLVHSFGDGGKYLRLAEGTPTLNILQMIEGDLRTAVRSALFRVASDGTAVVYKDIKFEHNNEERVVSVSVEPYQTKGQKLYLVCLEEGDRPEPAGETMEAVAFDPASDDGQHITELERELEYTRETLRATVEELEASNEELQSTNEELVASNEELQATNEELQSVNEELYTVNGEYQQKIQELAQLADDTERLLGSANIGALFLDSDLRIQRFTKAITLHFDLVPHDIGRELSSFQNRIGIPHLADIAGEVSVSGSSYSKATEDEMGNPVLVKVARSTLGTGSPGIVINVVAQTAIAPLKADQLYLPTGAGYWEWPDVKADQMWWSPACYELLGLEVGEPKPGFSVWKQMVHPDDLAKLRQPGTNDCEFVRNGFLAVRMKKTDGTLAKFSFRGRFQQGEDKQPVSMTGSVAEVPS